MNHFEIFAHGESFDPDAFLATTTLRFDGVWRKGDKGRGHPKSNGVKKVLGDGMTMPPHDQERIAIDYLVANNDALKALAQFPGVTTFVLGLQHHVVLHENTVGFCVGLSAGLMSWALDIGIEPMIYITLDHTTCGRVRTEEEK